ncbi:MAG TPA: glycerate kinase [Bacteroidales bacterium]|nr:glycerate kinase [Bacteroidales bacterium]
MKILVAPDTFKNSLSAKEAAAAIARGISSVLPDAQITILPMADGGEGTVETLIGAAGGHIIKTYVSGPLMQKTRSFFGILADEHTAVIETAAASGISLLKKEEMNPLKTTTFGTGELMLEALKAKCTSIIVGLGGSATNDAGTGMARALGVKFFNKSGKLTGEGGGKLNEIEYIDLSGLDARLKSTIIIAAADVTNPITGINGATKVFAPQKGASPSEVEQLETNMIHFCKIVKKQLGIDISNLPFGGAAGGLGAGLSVFTNAELKSGFDLLSENTKLEEKIITADLIITGEGTIDRQTLFGKTPAGIARLSRKYHKPLVAFAGRIGKNHSTLYSAGFTRIISICDSTFSEEVCLRRAAGFLEIAAEKMIREWIVSTDT